MDGQVITAERKGGRFLYDMRDRQIVPNLVRDAATGWYKSQFPLEFDANGDGLMYHPVGKVVEQWLSAVRGPPRDPDTRVLIVGCQKRNIDPEGRFGLADHDRVVWWESDGRSDNKRATGLIPSRVAVLLTLKFIRHSLSDALAGQARQRGIVAPAMLSARDARLLMQIGLMDAAILEARLRPSIPTPIARLMETASSQAVVSTNVLMRGQIHKLVQGDDIPAPLEPMPVLPPILDSNGVIVKNAEASEAPVKKKRVIVNKAIGPVQRVLMQNTEIALDRTLTYSERARRLIGKCRDAGLNRTSEASLALAVKSFQDADDAAKAKAAKAQPAPEPVPTTAGEAPPAPPVETTAPASPPPPSPQDNSAIAKIRSLIEQQRAELKLAEEHVALSRVAQEEIADLVASAIDEARGEARRALEQTLASMRYA